MCHRALGNLDLALEPVRAALDGFLRSRRFGEAAAAACNLSRLYLNLRQLSDAHHYALNSVQLADKAGILSFRVEFQRVLADTLHQMGRIDASKAAYDAAEALQSPREHYGWGFHHCDLLLATQDVLGARRLALGMLRQARA